MQEVGRDDDGEMLGVCHFTQVDQGRRMLCRWSRDRGRSELRGDHEALGRP